MPTPTASQALEALARLQRSLTAAGDLLDDHAASALRAFIESSGADAEKSERRAIAFGDIVHLQILAMRGAVVAWQREGAQAGMRWIANTLAGPGHLPSDEDIALGAQALFDKEMAEYEAFRAAHPAPAARSQPPKDAA